MKKAVLILFILVSYLSSANVAKVYVSHASEPLGTTPIHGTLSWTSYIGTGKLAFVKGNSYKLKVEYSGLIPPGTIKVSNSFAQVSNVVQAGNVFTFTLSVPETTDRLEKFQFGYNKTGTTLNYPINCEVIETGRLFSMVVKDTTNTLMVTFAPKSDQLLQMTFIKGTGQKDFMFYGSQLENIKFNSGMVNGSSSGLIYNATAFQSGGTSGFTLKATVTTVPAIGGKLTDLILSMLIDNAADKHYPWATYKYARKMEGTLKAPSATGDSGSSGVSGGTLQFEVLPGTIIPLTNGFNGFYNFLSSGFNIN